MTMEEFTAEFDRLVAAFAVAKPNEKARIYFEELGALPNFPFHDAVREAIRTGDKFPTIARLLQVTNSKIEPESAKVRASCPLCDGYGWAFIGDYSYRGRCAHFQGLSEQIPLAPTEYQSGSTFDPTKILAGLLLVTDGDLGKLTPASALWKSWLTVIENLPEKEIERMTVVHKNRKGDGPEAILSAGGHGFRAALRAPAKPDPERLELDTK